PTVSILLGKGDGSFQAGTSYDTGYSFFSLRVVDFNGDGKLDLVTSGGNVLLGNGDGTFQAAQIIPGADAVWDFNGDGHLDLVWATYGTVLVLLGNSHGTFQDPLSYSYGAGYF